MFFQILLGIESGNIMVTPSGGQSINFYLITTGLPIDPNDGTLAHYYYNIIVGAIGLQADILIQNDVRTINNINVNSYLPGYSTSQRNAYQFLIGVAGYSDPFNKQSLIQAIQTYALAKSEPNLVGRDRPNVNDYCFDPIATLDVDGAFKIYRGISGQWLTQNFQAYYSNRMPLENDGYVGSIWIVNIGGQLQFLYNDAVKGWGPISNYGNVTYIGTPPEVDGDWWISPSEFIFRQFNGSTWGAPISYFYSVSPPGSGSFWLASVNDYTLEVRTLINSIWEPVKLSPSVVKLQSENSNFLNEYTSGEFNYTIDVEPLALYGGPINTGSTSTMTVSYDQEIAAGGANELFTNFFTNFPILGTTEIFVNGELQDLNGVIITGKNLQFIDSANGFSLSSGDDVVAFYQYSI